MNYLQLFLFLLFALISFCLGVGVLVWLKGEERSFYSKLLYMAEACLLGAIFIVGELVSLSLLGLYREPFLWGVVLVNLGVLLNSQVRKKIVEIFSIKFSKDIFVWAFVLLTGIFILRNIYFLVDVDSHSSYLASQKLWLEHHSSIFGDRGMDIRVFVPNFDGVPYSLGLSLFGLDTYFPQLINLFWRLLALFLVYGYTKYRFGSLAALFAGMLLIFNDHFFISGANQWVLINGVIIALIFASAYSFWEGRRQKSSYRFFLGILFLTPLMANKYQMLYIMVFLFGVGLWIQSKPIDYIKDILKNKRWLTVLLISIFLTSLWYLKNFIATGDPFFPVFAGKMHVLGISPVKEEVFMQAFRGLKPSEIIKYLNFLFIWPGITAAKYVLLSIIFLPFILMAAFFKNRVNKEDSEELFYWLGLSVLLITGICLASHQDPRYFRFSIGVSAFAAILAIRYVFIHSLGVKHPWVMGIVMLVLALPGYQIMFISGGFSVRPSLKDNFAVLFNQMHFKDVIDRHYGDNVIAQKGFDENLEKSMKSAWYVDLVDETNFSVFLAPTRPKISFWNTNIIKWDSFAKEELVAKDIKDFGLNYVMLVSSGELVYQTPEEFAKRAVKFDRYPKSIFFPYTFPEELTRTKYYVEQ